MRPTVSLISLALSLLFVGCGEAAPDAPLSAMSVDNQEAEAARVFLAAQALEKKGQSQEALAAYRHIDRNFPKTVHGKKAGDRIRRLQH